MGVGSVLALAPSLLQALPYTREGTLHFVVLLVAALALVGGALWTRRKVPLLAGSAGLLLGTLLKLGQWASHREVLLPALGVLFGLAILSVGVFFESRMNRALRSAVDKARAQARMFWETWD